MRRLAPAVVIAIVFFVGTYVLGPAVFDEGGASVGRALAAAIGAFVGWYVVATLAERRKPHR